MRNLLLTNQILAIKQALSANPSLANEGIPFDEKNTTKAHPLHRIADGVFCNVFSDEQAVEIAKVFLQHGADIDGDTLLEKRDTPLIAAASLNADRLAILYIDNGANIHHQGTHGGTVLHWACWCGREALVKRLLQENPAINQHCIDFSSTPLFWTIHGFKNTDQKNPSSYLECVRLLLEAGADKSIPNAEGKTVYDLLGDGDEAFIELLK